MRSTVFTDRSIPCWHELLQETANDFYRVKTKLRSNNDPVNVVDLSAVSENVLPQLDMLILYTEHIRIAMAHRMHKMVSETLQAADLVPFGQISWIVEA